MRLPSRLILVLVYACLHVLTLSPLHGGITTRVSVSSDGTQANGESGGWFSQCSISADGRYVAFQSRASNLVPGDTNGSEDVFVRDRQSGVTERVSVSSGGTQGDYGSYSPSISADGRFVAFASSASNLVPGDTRGYWYNGTWYSSSCPDVFVRDRQTGVTARISVASDGAQGNSISGRPSISADGRFVAFDSEASNLVSGDSNRSRDVLVHDRQAGVTRMVSMSSRGTQGDYDSYNSSVSADGRFVAFVSEASNLVAGDSNGTYDAFVHELRTGVTERVSVANDETQGHSSNDRPSISADGRYVVFASHASNLVPDDTNDAQDIVVHDRQTGVTERVSVASDGTQAVGHSHTLSISADGRYVAFASSAYNLVPGDTNAERDVLVHDRQTGVTERISVASDGTQGNSNSGWFDPPSVSADGRFVAFYSSASNLVPGDTNESRDIFVHDRLGNELSPDLPIPDFTLTPGTLGGGANVIASVVAPGAVSASIRVSGLTRDNPTIAMRWNGSAWSATINGSLASWASGSVLTVWATVSDGAGRTGTACRLLSVERPAVPSGSGDPDAVWVDESDGRGMVTGTVEQLLSTGPPLKARISMDTVVTGLLGVSGSMNIWPEVTNNGIKADPAADYSLGAVLARLGLFSPSGGPAYDLTFNAVKDRVTFTASFGAKSLGMTILDNIAEVVAGASGYPVPSPADLAETYAAFAELAPVRAAVGRFSPWPPGWRLPWAAGQAAWDLSEFVRNDYEWATLKTILQRLFKKEIKRAKCVEALDALLAPYNLLKTLRDEILWGIQTTDGDPVIAFEAYRTASGSLALRATTEGPSGGLVRTEGAGISFSLSESEATVSHTFTLSNTQGAPIWEWRVGLDGDQPQPTGVSAPPGWKCDIVWTMDERCVRFWTEGPNGWAAGDFGSSVINEGSSLSGFSFTLHYRLQQCYFTATDTALRMDGGMLSMVPDLSATPPDFAPAEGETTKLQAYLDRPATTSLKVFWAGAEYVTIQADESHTAGEFSAVWDGMAADCQPAPPGDYEARLHIVYEDGDTADLSTPMRVVTGLAVDSIGELRSLPDGRQVRLVGKTATMGTSGSPSFIYAEDPDRCAGIRVMTSAVITEGSVVSLSGAVSLLDGETVISDSTVTTVATGGDAPASLGLPNRWLGGSGSGIADAHGLYNIGLLIRTWGSVTQVGEGYLYLADGSALKDGTMTGAEENVGVRVICDPAGYSTGDKVQVTGISSCFQTPSGLARRILTRRPEDIRKLNGP